MNVRHGISLLYGTAVLILAIVAMTNIVFEYRDPTADTLIERATLLAADHRETVGIPENLWPQFKRALLRRQSDIIDSVIIGSSTLLGHRPRSLFGPGHWLNMALNTNYLFASLGQAQQYLRDTPKLKQIAIALDWGLGMPFKVETYDSEASQIHPVWLDLVRDSLSLSRTKRSIKIIVDQVADRWDKWFGLTDRWIGSETVRLCSSGEEAVSFVGGDPCAGIRADGSIGFLDPAYAGHYSFITPENSAKLLDKNQISQNIYFQYFTPFHGLLPPENRRSLEALASTLSDRGGGLTLVMPPMLPGLAKMIGEDPVAGPMLKTFKGDIDQWAAAHHVQVVDLNASERFGCLRSDFGDGHHGLTSCWTKIAAFYEKPVEGNTKNILDMAPADKR